MYINLVFYQRVQRRLDMPKAPLQRFTFLQKEYMYINFSTMQQNILVIAYTICTWQEWQSCIATPNCNLLIWLWIQLILLKAHIALKLSWSKIQISSMPQHSPSLSLRLLRVTWNTTWSNAIKGIHLGSAYSMSNLLCYKYTCGFTISHPCL